MEDDESEEEAHVAIKRKADTDCKNADFEMHLKERAGRSPTNFQAVNRERVNSMNTGRPLKERIDVPDGFEIYQYGNQKLNIWEFQKEQLRKHIAEDPSNFYTYSKDYLAGAFPLVNEAEIEMRAKLENESKWKTKKGFDYIMKNENWNEHPKKPAQSTIDDLKIPYVVAMEDTKAKLKAAVYNPASDGKADF